MRAFAIIVIVLLLAQAGVAREESVSIGPDNFLYSFRIWMEKFSINFISNQTEKTQRILDLADERLREAEMMENNSLAFERAMDEYTSQLEELQSIINADAYDENRSIHVNITEKIEDQAKRTKALKSMGKVSIIQQSIVEASSSSGESKIRVSAVDGNVSVETQGGNPVITRDGNNVTVISETNNSRQQVIVRSSRNNSSSSSVVVSQSSSIAISGN
ncbi:MAG: hypothetical protein FIB08_08725 [Candidatus Methanoperedens sp.]|nr:hypothetical protein [Candidatus Methanoperedens sp.]